MSLKPAVRSVVQRGSLEVPINGGPETVSSRPVLRKKTWTWSPEEDERLSMMVVAKIPYKEISRLLARTEAECVSRWNQVLDPSRVKGAWTTEEDNLIIELLHKHDTSSWSLVAHHLPGRSGKQIRLRWHNHLRPGIKKDPWTIKEDEIIIRHQAAWGNKWAAIARLLPGRTDNSVKNYWNSSLKRRSEVPANTNAQPWPRNHSNATIPLPIEDEDSQGSHAYYDQYENGKYRVPSKLEILCAEALRQLDVENKNSNPHTTPISYSPRSSTANSTNTPTNPPSRPHLHPNIDPPLCKPKFQEVSGQPNNSNSNDNHDGMVVEQKQENNKRREEEREKQSKPSDTSQHTKHVISTDELEQEQEQEPLLTSEEIPISPQISTVYPEAESVLPHLPATSPNNKNNSGSNHNPNPNPNSKPTRKQPPTSGLVPTPPQPSDYYHFKGLKREYTNQRAGIRCLNGVSNHSEKISSAVNEPGRVYEIFRDGVLPATRFQSVNVNDRVEPPFNVFSLPKSSTRTTPISTTSHSMYTNDRETNKENLYFHHKSPLYTCSYSLPSTYVANQNQAEPQPTNKLYPNIEHRSSNQLQASVFISSQSHLEDIKRQKVVGRTDVLTRIGKRLRTSSSDMVFNKMIQPLQAYPDPHISKWRANQELPSSHIWVQPQPLVPLSANTPIISPGFSGGPTPCSPYIQSQLDSYERVADRKRPLEDDNHGDDLIRHRPLILGRSDKGRCRHKSPVNHIVQGLSPVKAIGGFSDYKQHKPPY